MKKRTNKTRNFLKADSFFYYYIFLFPIVIIINFFVYLAQPVLTKPLFFMNVKNLSLQKPVPSNLYPFEWNKKIDVRMTEGVSNGMVFHGDRSKKMIALTFDADMTSGMADMLRNGYMQSLYDERLIDVLRESQTPATLFVTGMWAEMYPSETQELANDPLFELGSHSYAHMAYTNDCFGLETISPDEKIQDIGTSQFLIQKYTGKKTKLFRFPGGCYSFEDIILLRTAGMTPVQWDVVANDGFNPNPDEILSNIVSRVKNGSIIVMHMNGFPNEPVDYIVVPEVIKILRERGFEFVTVSRLLQDDRLY